MSDPKDARQMIEEILASGRRPVIFVTFLDNPAEQVTRMITRALGDEHTKGIRRIVPIPLMAKTLVSIPKTVAALQAEFPQAILVHSIDNSGKPGEAKFYDGLSRAAENADKWTEESALEVMRAQLEKLRTTREIPEKSYRRAFGSPQGQPGDRQENGGRDEQAPAPQASEGLNPQPAEQKISVPPEMFKQITDAYSADTIAAYGSKKPTIRPPFTYEGRQWTTVLTQGSGITGRAEAQAYRLVPLEANEGGLSYHKTNSEERRNRPEGPYHGIEVSSHGKRFTMEGPPVTFVPGEEPKPAATRWDEDYQKYKALSDKLDNDPGPPAVVRAPTFGDALNNPDYSQSGEAARQAKIDAHEAWDAAMRRGQEQLKELGEPIRQAYLSTLKPPQRSWKKNISVDAAYRELQKAAQPKPALSPEAARKKELGKDRAANTRDQKKRLQAMDAAHPAPPEVPRPELRNYSGEVRDLAGDANFKKVSVSAENRRHAEQLLAEQFPGKHISEVGRLPQKWGVASTPKAEENKPLTHEHEDQAARGPGNAEDVPSVPGPAGGSGETPRAVQPQGVREDEGSGDAALDAGRADAVGLEHAGGREEERSPSERGGGSSEPDLVPARGGRSGLPVAAAQKALPRNTNNFHISDEYAAQIGTGGEISKIKGNLDALETLKKIQAEGRETATPEEQQTLAKYVDFGGLVGMLQKSASGCSPSSGSSLWPMCRCRVLCVEFVIELYFFGRTDLPRWGLFRSQNFNFGIIGAAGFRALLYLEDPHSSVESTAAG
jgi:hypothetical protein